MRPRLKATAPRSLHSAWVRDRAAARVVAVRARVLAHPRWRWMALMVVASGMMLSVVNVSIVNIALPEMADDLGVDVPSISWVVTGFLVTQATLLAIAGRATSTAGGGSSSRGCWC